jgi:hypothetical protein
MRNMTLEMAVATVKMHVEKYCTNHMFAPSKAAYTALIQHIPSSRKCKLRLLMK